MKPFNLVSSLAIVSFAMTASAAQAQSNGGTPNASTDPQEIIVTAQRREQNVRDVPMSIDVVGEEKIRDQGIEDVQRLAESLPSLVVGGQDSTLGGLNLTIRGVGSSSGDPAVGFYVDDVYIPNPGGFVSQFIDVARVEVLNGPQGTLFGRNTTGGVVHFITQQPGPDFKAQAYFETGWYDSLSFSSVPIIKAGVSVNVPITDSLSARASISHVSQSNYTFNLERKQPEPNQNAVTLRGGISFHPTDRFEIILNADYINDPNHNSFLFKNRVTPGSSIAFVYDLISDIGAEQDPFRVRSDLRPVTNYKELGLRAKLTYRLTDGLQFRSITGYRELNANRAMDLDVTQAPILYNKSQQDDQSFSQEMQLVYESDRLNAIGGLYYFDRDYQQNAQSFSSLPFFFLNSCNSSNEPPPTLAPLCPTLTSVATVFIPAITGRQPVLADFLAGGLFETLTGVSASTASPVTTIARALNLKSYAAYAQASYALTDRLTLTAGGRYTLDKKSITSLHTTAGTGAAPISLDESFSSFTPKLALEFRPNADTLTFASITKGFKSGDLNLFANLLAGENPRVNPETIWSYEAGFRTSLADRKITLDASAFYYDYSDYQLNVQFAEGVRLFNLDKVQIYGFEFKPVFRPVPRLMLGASATYLHTEVRRSSRSFLNPFDVAAGPINPVGLGLPQSPNWKANAFINYVQPIGASSLSFGLDATHSGKFNNDLFGSFPNDSYTIVNGNVRLTTLRDHLSVNLFARNIFNKVYTTSSLFSDAVGELYFYAPPRTIGLQLSFKY